MSYETIMKKQSQLCALLSVFAGPIGCKHLYCPDIFTPETGERRLWRCTIPSVLYFFFIVFSMSIFYQLACLLSLSVLSSFSTGQELVAWTMQIVLTLKYLLQPCDELLCCPAKYIISWLPRPPHPITRFSCFRCLFLFKFGGVFCLFVYVSVLNSVFFGIYFWWRSEIGVFCDLCRKSKRISTAFFENTALCTQFSAK